MPEVDFRLNRKEQIKLVEYLYSKGCKLVVDKDYTEHVPLYLANIEEYSPFADGHNQFFVIHELYTTRGFEFRSFEREGKKLLYISPRVEGPTIDLRHTGDIEKEGVKYIRGSNLSHYTYFWDKDTTYTFDAPEELKVIYKDIVNFLKKMSVKIKVEKRTYWIGKLAIEDLKNGYQLYDMDKKYWEHLLS